MQAMRTGSDRETGQSPTTLNVQETDIPKDIKQETPPSSPEHATQENQVSRDQQTEPQEIVRWLPIEHREVRIAPKSIARLREPGIHFTHKRADVMISIPKDVYVDFKTRSKRNRFPSTKFANLVLKEFPNSISHKYDLSHIFRCFRYGSHRITFYEWDIRKSEMDAKDF